MFFRLDFRKTLEIAYRTGTSAERPWKKKEANVENGKIQLCKNIRLPKVM
jgi:hypothetical protein